MSQQYRDLLDTVIEELKRLRAEVARLTAEKKTGGTESKVD